MLVQARAIWPKKPRSVRSCRRKGDSPHSGQNRAETLQLHEGQFHGSIAFIALEFLGDLLIGSLLGQNGEGYQLVVL